RSADRLRRVAERKRSLSDPQERAPIMADSNEESLLADCRARAIELLENNSSPGGVLAAAANPRAERRGYTAIFGRDAAICALGMAVSGHRNLERAASAGLETIAAHQAPNGQMPKFVDPHVPDADFWYLGCIDSTLWWLIAVEY